MAKSPRLLTSLRIGRPEAFSLSGPSNEQLPADQLYGTRAWQVRGWDAYDCLDASTEILTPDGWVTHDRLNPGDLVMTLDPDSGTSGWEPVESISRFEVEDEPMLSIESQRHSSLSTWHHRWPVLRWEWRRGAIPPERQRLVRRWATSSTLGSDDKVTTAAPARDLPTEAKWSDAFVEVVAWFFTEGHIRPDRRNPGVSINQSEAVNAPYVARISAALAAAFGPQRPLGQGRTVSDVPGWSISANKGTRGDMAVFKLNVAASALLLDVAPDRVVRLDFVRHLTRAQLELFISVALMADGYVQRGVISQKVSERLDAIELAAILSGRTPVRRTCRTTGKFLLTIGEQTTASIDVRIRSEARYTGTIWCPKTPSKTWMARRCGTVYFTGNTVPENHATTAFISACLSRLRWRLAWLGDDDEPGPVWDEDGELREGIDPTAAELGRALVRTIRSKRGGSTRLLGRIGSNLAQVGELSLVPREQSGRRYFDAYSIDELRPQADGTYIRYASPGRTAETFRPDPKTKKAPLVIRVHRAHPRFEEWADAPTRALLPTLEVMELLTREMRSSTVSRIMGPGILWVSEDADLPPDPEHPDREGLTAQLAAVAGVAIREPGSAAAQVPVIVRVPQEVVEKGIRETTFAQTDLNTIPKRDASVQTYARGAELPVEQVTGMGAANHWGAWMIDETTAKIYIAPLMEVVNGILTDDYLHASFRVALGLDEGAELPPAYAGFVLDYDDAALVVHPDRSAAAQEAYGTSTAPNFAISEQAYRDARGFSETDAPEAEEIERRMQLAERLRRSAAPPQYPGQGPGNVNPGPPPAAESADHADVVTLARISAAVEVAAERAVDRLGSRLRAAAPGKLSAANAAALVGRPSRDVPVLLGMEAAALIIPPDDQFRGEFAALERTVGKWMNGSPTGPQVARNVATAAEALARALAVTPEARLDPESLAACVRGR